MKNKRKNILLIAGMLLALLVGILAYSAYTQKQIYQESTANLLSTYGQSAKTFTMFAQRNWNMLGILFGLAALIVLPLLLEIPWLPETVRAWVGTGMVSANL